MEFESGEVHSRMNAKLGDERVGRDAELKKKNNVKDLINEAENGRAQ